jgi:predicted Rossmann fold nucleotide-binding protein DprA/Smf involved in DNA uptake
VKIKVAISGIRDLDEASEAVVSLRVAELLSVEPAEVIFGGARGTDTVALAAACLSKSPKVKIVVMVPGKAADQPQEARGWISQCADEIVELGLPVRQKWTYLARNRAMIARAGMLLAFWDGEPGGTAYTVAEATKAGLAVHVEPVTRVVKGGKGPDLGSIGNRYPA